MKKKVGKPKYIATPQRMWDLFLAYCEKTKSDPFKEHDFVGKEGISIHRERERCLTMDGFELHCMEVGEIIDFGDYFSNKQGRYSEYAAVCSRVKKTIRKDQIEGGMAGIYNPSITQRLNGLVDRSETVVVEQPLFPDVD